MTAFTDRLDRRATPRPDAGAPAKRTPEEVCESKVRHPDELVARAAAAHRIAANRNADRLYVYRCTVCRGWHLTRFPVGIPVTADDTHAVDAWREEVAPFLARERVQTYRDCPFGELRFQKWLHQTFLRLEAEGLVKRHFERENAITWVKA